MEEKQITERNLHRRQFIIAIENKVDSKEGEDQTNHEWADLQRRKKLNPKAKLTALFLTADQTRPSNMFFEQISWQSIAKIFESFAGLAKPQLVRVFAQHYSETLRREIVLETGSENTNLK